MRDNIAFLGIMGKQIGITVDFCLVGNLLRMTEPTSPIRQSTTFGIMMDMKCVNQLAKTGDHASPFNKR
jgi:hypothetical protein